MSSSNVGKNLPALLSDGLHMKLTETQLRRIISRETKVILREKKGDESTKEKGRKSFSDYKAAASAVSNKLDVSDGPTSIRAFLNGPGKDPKVRTVLAGGQTDGSPDDEATAPTETSVAVGSLIPTQSEIELTKSIAFPLAVLKGLKNSCGSGVKKIGPPGNDKIVISGNLIVDGHHRWSSLFAVGGPEAQIAAIDLGIPEQDAASVLAATQVAIASTLRGGETLPSAEAGASNILGAGKDAIKKMIEDAVASGSGEKGPMLTDGFVEACIKDKTIAAQFDLSPDMSVEDARAAIIEKVADNLGQLPQPASGAPPRDDMPQIDAATGGVKGVVKALGSGKVNYKEPFSSGVKSEKEKPTAQESSLPRGEILIERWQKLAGLIK